MADTPESLVYSGQEGTGAARIFGREGNPFKALMAKKQQAQQEEALKAAQAAKQREAVDKKVFDLITKSPEKTYQPFNDQILGLANRHRDNIQQLADKGLDERKLTNYAIQGWDEVNSQARQGVFVQDKLNAALQTVSGNPYLKNGLQHYVKEFNNAIYDEKGNVRNLNDVDPNTFDKYVNEDVTVFDRKAYAKDFMKDLKNNVLSYVEQRNLAEGLETRDIKLKIPELIYVADKNDPSGIKRNPDGSPVINVTPDFKQAFLEQNPLAKKAFEADAAKLGKPIDEIIKSWIETEGPKPEKDIQVQISRNPEWYFDNMQAAKFGVSPRELPLYTRRWQNINNAINAFTNQDGTRRDEPTPEAKVALGYLKNNMKVGGADVLDAIFVKGTNTPGTSQVMGMPVQNSPNDRIVFKTKQGARGFAQPHELNLADEGGGAVLNSMYETAKTEGKVNISFDKLLQMNDVKPSDVYQGRAGLTQQNEQSKEKENVSVAQWQEGKGLEELAGRSFNGQRIVTAQKIKTDPGTFGWGAKYAIELQVDSGDPSNPIKYINVPVEDYEQLAGIYRGQSGAAPKTGESGVAWKK